MNTPQKENSNTENNHDVKRRKPKRQKSPVKKTVLIATAVVLTAILALVSVVAYVYFFHEPDTGSKLPPPFDTSGINDTKAPETQPEPPQSDTAETEPPQTEPPVTEPPVETEQPRSEQKIYNFLFVGQDRIALNTDVMMLISFNTTKNNINVVQIPRDTYVETDGYYGKLNGLFAHYYINRVNDTKKALRMVADTLEQTLCVKIHNVGHINLNGVVALVDKIGGVDVNIPAPITYVDPATKTFKTLPAGMQHLNGMLAEEFITHRATYLQADIGRIDAQKVFLSAFIQKLKQSFGISTIGTFVEFANDHVTTDVSLADSVFYAKQMLEVNMQDIRMMSMIGRGATVNGLSCWIMVRKNMLSMINRYFNIYDFEITDSIFDKDRKFTSLYAYPFINDIYNIQDIPDNDPYNAEDVYEGSIYIPHV